MEEWTSVGGYMAGATGTQWTQIVGTVPASSNLYTLPSWLAGASSLALAKRKCADAPLTAGGKVTLTQGPSPEYLTLVELKPSSPKTSGPFLSVSGRLF